MDGLVSVGFAIGNIVLETTRHGFPKLMDVAQHGIDITVSAQNATNGNQIVDLIKPLLLVLHFAVDGVNMLGTTINLPMQIALTRVGFNLVDNFLYQSFPLSTLLLHHVGDFIKFRRIEIAERQVFQFPLDAGNPQTMGQRSIDFHRFLRDSLLLVWP